MDRLKATIEELYNGSSHRSAAFRFALLGFDLFTIAFLIVMR